MAARKPIPTERELLDAMRKRWPEDAYATITQVRNQTGYGSSVRTADAIVFGLWPSRGLEIHGVEIKRSLSDYRKEAADPAKAAAFARYCDHWWIVAPKGIVPVDEIPAKWGLLEMSRGTLKAAVSAPRLERAEMPHKQWVSIMRSLAKIPAQEMAGIKRAIREEERTAADDRWSMQIENHIKVLDQFQDATGVDLRSVWDRDAMYAAIKSYHQDKDQHTQIQRSRTLAGTLRRHATEMGKIADALETAVDTSDQLTLTSD